MLERVPLDVGVDVGQAAAEVGAQHREQRLHLKDVNLEKKETIYIKHKITFLNTHM